MAKQKEIKLPSGPQAGGAVQMEPESGNTPYEFYLDGEPTRCGQPVPEVTASEVAIAVRCAKVFRPELARRYLHTKKKRIRKKYEKRILVWYWGVFS